ncbi:MAG: NAD(P)/FAD-dependent oxidoreductase [Gordonia sp. (in: high G+C Gram-positive bacteria)]|uniref:flavin-containing monooxygenase n=1 Tax=Gordonia sp. (in: high G+C Gram-positive bacteria) TaxID=84139 RepID=UPI003C782A54
MSSTPQPEYFDVVVIGGGISGIGAAVYITQEFPKKKVALLEGRDSVGGTWDLFRYPGIRSDSDLHTFAYEFKAWKNEKAIADAPLILDYLKETVEDYGLDEIIRYRHHVTSAAWSSDDAEWVLTVDVTDDNGTVRQDVIKTGWVFGATGYYRYDEGFTPAFASRDEFQGDIIHPQHWPEDYDYTGKKVVVIGSGATAITLIPSMLKGEGAASHVTMLQRTPTYILTLPRVDTLSLKLTKLLGERRGYLATRWKNTLTDWGLMKALTTFPKAGRKFIRWVNQQELPDGFDVDKHFNPPYEPWDQRLCLAPDGDFFASIRDGDADVVTDRIRRFTKTGIELESGEHLDADIIVTATGLNMRLLGGVDVSVDGHRVDVSKSVVYRGMLLSGIPNWVLAVGYTKSSWTLKIGLLGKSFVELLRYMDTHGYDTAVPEAPEGTGTRPSIDLDSGYMLRARNTLPRQGDEAPWQIKQVFLEDRKMFRGPVITDALHFSSRLERELDTSVAADGGQR